MVHKVGVVRSPAGQEGGIQLVLGSSEVGNLKRQQVHLLYLCCPSLACLACLSGGGGGVLSWESIEEGMRPMAGQGCCNRKAVACVSHFTANLQELSPDSSAAVTAISG